MIFRNWVYFKIFKCCFVQPAITPLRSTQTCEEIDFGTFVLAQQIPHVCPISQRSTYRPRGQLKRMIQILQCCAQRTWRGRILHSHSLSLYKTIESRAIKSMFN